jgi:hypothetical protein
LKTGNGNRWETVEECERGKKEGGEMLRGMGQTEGLVKSRNANFSRRSVPDCFSKLLSMSLYC